MVDRFDLLTLTDLRDFVANGQEENLHLDFKTVRDAGMGSADDKRTLAKALSGFANSSGGLVIWGVDARKNNDGVDCAVGLKPIQPVTLLLTRLNSLTADGVDPTVPGVRHRTIEDSPGSGFIVTLVPESDSGPHMAKLRDDHYYKRVGDSFYRMEHYDIADMFGRRHRPQLEVFYRVKAIGQNATVHLGIRNAGRATARAPYFAFGCPPPLARSPYGLDGNGSEGLSYLRFSNSGYQWAYGGGMNFAIHPRMEHDVACIWLGRQAKPPPTKDCVVEFAVACEDQPIRHGTITIPVAELT